MRLTGNPKLLYGTLSVIIAGLFFTSCHTKPVKHLQGTEIPLREMKKNEAVFEVTGYPLPTSFYITSLLKEAEAPYIPTISNPVDNADHYFSQREKAINLGVFGADLCYAVTYMKTQEILLYLNVSKRLRDEINIMTSFYQNCYQRVENNLNIEDSLISIISDSFYDTYNYLTHNQKDKMAILVLSGSWIEGLYITTQIGLTARNNQKILEIIAEQETSLNKLLEIMQPVKDDKEITDIFHDLFEIQRIYAAYNGNFNKQLFEKITEAIDSLHDKII